MIIIIPFLIGYLNAVLIGTKYIIPLVTPNPTT